MTILLKVIAYGEGYLKAERRTREKKPNKFVA